jgi:hypothetical protein
MVAYLISQSQLIMVQQPEPVQQQLYACLVICMAARGCICMQNAALPCDGIS